MNFTWQKRANRKVKYKARVNKIITFNRTRTIYNGNRTEWSPIRSLKIIRAINKIGRLRSGSPIC